MNDPEDNNTPTPSGETQDRRLFLKGVGKWSGAAIMAAVAGAFVGTAPEARAAAWINRRGGWINGGGGWLNRAGGGGAWVNRGGGGGGWVNRRAGGGSWVNRR